MAYDILFYTFLLSISPFGEARAGIPYAIVNEVDVMWALIVGLGANLLVYPLFSFLIHKFNDRLWPYRLYKKSLVKLSRTAKKGVGPKITRHGFWGLMIFVMIPLPGTGAYMGTIAAAIFGINRWKAFLAISLGTIISCILMALGMHLGSLGFSSL